MRATAWAARKEEEKSVCRDEVWLFNCFGAGPTVFSEKLVCVCERGLADVLYTSASKTNLLSLSLIDR